MMSRRLSEVLMAQSSKMSECSFRFTQLSQRKDDVKHFSGRFLYATGSSVSNIEKNLDTGI
jgi:hypothetical protein